MGIDELNQIFDSKFILNSSTCISEEDVLEVFKAGGIDITIRMLVKYMRERGVGYVKDMRTGRVGNSRGGFTGIDWNPVPMASLELDSQVMPSIRKQDTDKQEDTVVVTNTPGPLDGINVGFHGKVLSPASINTWTKKVITLQSLGVDFNDYDDIVKTIETQWKNINTRRDYLDALLRQLYLMKADIELAKKLQIVRDGYKNKYNQERKKNNLNQKEKENWVDWEDVVKKRDTTDNLAWKVVLGLYSYHPPRRIEDYHEMYWIAEDQEPVEADANYCLGFESFEFNKYKTFHIYGQQVIRIQSELRELLKLWVTKMGIQSGARLLGTLDIRKTLYEIFGKNVGVNILRKSYITVINKATISEEVRELIARLMGHSAEESRKYQKVEGITL